MARAGARVLVVERELTFRDRNRGEYIHPWGVLEGRALGITSRLLETCGHPVDWRTAYDGGALVARRHLTPARGCAGIGFHHPEMQEVLLALARESGAEIRRGVTVTDAQPGTPPSIELDGGERIAARLVVGADGRTSRARRWTGLATLRDPECLVIAGIFHGGLDLPSDSVHTVYDPHLGQAVLIFPVGRERFRTYFYYARQGPPRPLHDERHAGNFVAACVETGAPSAWFAHARVLGPLASFEAFDRWLEHPYRKGVVLIGDAAAATDPAFGDGLSLTLRDVRTLSGRLLATSDWDQAAEAYAVEHARYYGALRRIQGWTRELLFERGPAADARRAHALPLLAKEPDRRLDYPAWGPDGPSDEAARRRFYGED